MIKTTGSQSRDQVKRLGLRANFSWTLAGTLTASGCQWIMLMVMAKLLPPEQVGYYALALAITSPVMMLSMLQLRAVQVTDIENRYQFADYLGVRLTTNVASALITFGIMVILIGRYSFVVYVLIFIVLINKAIQATGDITYGLMQKHERLDRVAKSRIYRNVGAVFLLFVVLYFTRHLLLGVLAVGLWWLFILLTFDRRNVGRYTYWMPRFHPKDLLHIMWIGLPMGVARGLVSLDQSIPRYFIEAHLGAGNLAVFAGMAYTVIAAGQCIEALGYATAARLAKYFVTSRSSYLRLLSKMLAIAALIALATVLLGVLFGEQFLTLVYRKEYASQPVVFTWLLVVAGARMISSMLWHGLIAARRFKSQVPLSSIFLFISFVGCWFLVPTYGMKGAAWAMMLSVVVRILGSTIVIALAVKSPPGPVSEPVKTESSNGTFYGDVVNNTSLSED